VVDLETGEWHHTNRLAEELVPRSDLPPAAVVHAVGDAAALSPLAAARRSGDYREPPPARGTSGDSLGPSPRAP